jgi:hypothetical protein
MTFTYTAHTVSIHTDNGAVQLVFQVDKKDLKRFQEAMHTRSRLQVENFNVRNLRVFLRGISAEGVRILQPI